jgi:hypothetical protein
MTEKKKIKKPIDPLSMKPGQNYGTNKYKKSKEYDGGKMTFEEEKENEKKKEDKKE